VLIRHVDPAHPDAGLLAQIAAIIERGGVVAGPTDTLYGLIADPTNANAVLRLYDLKGRPGDRAIPLIASDRAQIETTLGPLPARARILADRWWPGPLSLLIDAGPWVVPAVHGGTGRVAVRVPAHEVARALCRGVGRPLTATSANRSGAPAATTAAEVQAQLDEGLSAILDAGPAPGGPPSTIVDVTGPRPVLIRAGTIPWEHVLRCLEEADAS